MSWSTIVGYERTVGEGGLGIQSGCNKRRDSLCIVPLLAPVSEGVALVPPSKLRRITADASRELDLDVGKGVAAASAPKPPPTRVVCPRSYNGLIEELGNRKTVVVGSLNKVSTSGLCNDLECRSTAKSGVGGA